MTSFSTPKNLRSFITLDRMNQVSSVKCDKCGKVFQSSALFNKYSYNDIIIVLCKDCAAEELKKGTVSRINS